MPKHILHFTLLAVWFFLRGSASAQIAAKPAFRHYTVINGLPSNEIYNLYQDAQGFIWIATDRGVSRFDGKTFVNYTPEDGLEQFAVFRIAGDSNGRVFFYCNNQKVSVWEKGRFTTLPLKQSVVVTGFGSFYLSGNNTLCVNNDIVQSLVSLKALTIDTSVLLKREHIRRLTPDELALKNRYCDTLLKPGTSVYGRERRYDLSAGQVGIIRNELQRHHFKLGELASNPFRIEIFKDTLYLLNHSWITLFTIGKDRLDKFREIKLPPLANSVELLGNGSIGVSTQKNGTLIVNSGHVKTYLPTGFTTCSLIDREGNVWMGTVKDGLYMAVENGFSVLDKKSGLAADQVLSVLPFKGGLWLGHDFGRLSRIDSAGIKKINLSDKSATALTTLNNIYIMTADNSKLLLATDDGIIEVREHKGKRSLNKQFPENAVKDILISNDSVYYLTTYGMVVTAPWPHQKIVTKKSYDKKLYYVAREADGNLLLGTTKGVFSMKTLANDKPLVLEERYADLNLQGITGISVCKNFTAIASGHNGVLLKNMAGKFILLKYPAIASFRTSKISFENDSTLLVCTNKGLTRIRFSPELAIQKTDHFTTSSGLPSDFINDVRVYNNQYYIATDKGIGIAPTQIESSFAKPWMATQMDNYNKTYHSTDKINIAFTGFSFKSLGQVTYKYRLNGIDTGWSTTTENHRVYEYLPPGHYTFESKVIDRFGNESLNSFNLPILVEPFWYQRNSLKILVLAVFIGLVFLAIRMYYTILMKVQQSEFLKKMAVQQERQRISSEIHDDIGSGLAGIKLLTEIISSKSKDGLVASEIKAIYQSVSELSSKMREVIWSLSTEHDNLENLILFLHRECGKMMDNSSIKMVFTVEGAIPAAEINGKDRRHIYLAVKETLHNCLKHSSADKCCVTVSFEGNTLIIEIKDNGRGFDPKTTAHSGNGLHNIQNRMNELYGTLQISNDNGTVVRLHIPLTQI